MLPILPTPCRISRKLYTRGPPLKKQTLLREDHKNVFFLFYPGQHDGLLCILCPFFPPHGQISFSCDILQLFYNTCLAADFYFNSVRPPRWFCSPPRYLSSLFGVIQILVNTSYSYRPLVLLPISRIFAFGVPSLLPGRGCLSSSRNPCLSFGVRFDHVTRLN